MIFHIVDIAAIEGRNPIEDFNKINEELSKFSQKLSTKKQIILANKMDLLWDTESFQEFKAYVEKQGHTVYPLSVILNDGIKELLFNTWDAIQSIPPEPLEEESNIKQVLREIQGVDEDFAILEVEEGIFEVKGRLVDNVLNKYVITMEEDSILEFIHMLKSLGLENALLDAGIQDGDTVRIAEVEFEFVD